MHKHHDYGYHWVRFVCVDDDVVVGVDVDVVVVVTPFPVLPKLLTRKKYVFQFVVDQTWCTLSVWLFYYRICVCVLYNLLSKFSIQHFIGDDELYIFFECITSHEIIIFFH